MKKLIIIFVLLLSLVAPNISEARGFSGGHSSFSHSSSFGSHTTTTRSSTYRSGYIAPSSNVSRTRSYTQSRSSNKGSFWSHAAAFGAGTFIGSMFHPFGGHYYGQSYGFSMFGVLIDLLILFIIIRVIKAIFTRRRY
jgi:hypothetical protein